MNDKQFIDVSNPEGIFLESLVTRSPSRAIENQEARGQAALVAAQHLPRRFNGPKGMSYQEVFDKLGIEILREVDDLFFAVKLPEGWKIERTDHSMWSNLLDGKGRVRGAIFYKAAFYDRDAFWHLNRRFTFSSYNELTNTEGVVGVYDKCLTTGKAIFVAGIFQRGNDDYKAQEELGEMARAWLDHHYPDNANVFAYWDDEVATDIAQQ